MDIVIIGAGAAGCFCAIETKRLHPDATVTIYESKSRPMAKLAVTGGGRCNITNTFATVRRLQDVYPRGERLLKKAFSTLSPADTVKWWEKAGVRLVCADGQHIFPASQDAMQVVKTLSRLMERLGITLKCGSKVTSITAEADGKFRIGFADSTAVTADKTVVTTGGAATAMLSWLDIPIVSPVPSLFSFKLNDESLKSLQGSVTDHVSVSLSGGKYRSEGTLLVTDWGLSGPAILKLSSYGARYLADNAWQATLVINWLSLSEEDARSLMSECLADGKKMIATTVPEGLTHRIWKHLMSRAGLRQDIRWSEMGSKGLNRLVNACIADTYAVTGRGTFKEEFVTAGGVSAAAVRPESLESRTYPGLFFAGEVLDIDGITGGFNLQAAWSTGYHVARHIA